MSEKRNKNYCAEEKFNKSLGWNTIKVKSIAIEINKNQKHCCKKEEINKNCIPIPILIAPSTSSRAAKESED